MKEEKQQPNKFKDTKILTETEVEMIRETKATQNMIIIEMIVRIQDIMTIKEIIKDKIIDNNMIIVQETIAIKSMTTIEMIEETETIEKALI